MQADDFAGHLKILHFLHIVHGDIKRENIMWSNSLKKPVLIDFGLATIVKESIGEESFTHFFGTFSHCLPEMRRRAPTSQRDRTTKCSPMKVRMNKIQTLRSGF